MYIFIYDQCTSYVTRASLPYAVVKKQEREREYLRELNCNVVLFATQNREIEGI
jgi:hypothetical protein